MIPFLKNNRIKFPIALMSLLLLSFMMIFFVFAKKPKKINNNKLDPNMVEIPNGSFYMGASDEEYNFSLMNQKKLVSIQSFWMDRTEITNQQYRKFVNYVADSLKYLAIYGGGLNQDEDTIRVDWARAGRINIKSRAVLEKLNELLLSPDNRIQGKVELDPNKLVYRYSFVDLKAAARESKKLEKAIADYKITVNESIYPDTLVWMRDFSYSYNEPLTKLYFSHAAYNEYPVVGVSWKQALAFTHWRTNNSDYYAGKPGRNDQKIDGIYRLPTEAEWEYAARGNSRKNAMYPWGSPYTRTKEGRLLANFKPGRGDYLGGNPENDNIHTTKIKSYTENDFNLFDMAGNVAEWTSSAYYEGGFNFMGDFNPDVQYFAKDSDPILNKRKVTRGGSWKDIAYNCQVSTRNYEYQDTAKSFIGFRCVLSKAPRIN
jgi:gliding motility-associated lipoprotein GldK